MTRKENIMLRKSRDVEKRLSLLQKSTNLLRSVGLNYKVSKFMAKITIKFGHEKSITDQRKILRHHHTGGGGVPCDRSCTR